MLRSALAPSALSTPSPAACPAGAATAPPSAAVLMLVRYRAGASAWGLSRLALGPRDLLPAPGLRFAHVLGCGREGGFGLIPSLQHQGVIAFFDDACTARAFLLRSPALHARRERAAECLTALLVVASSRGSWSGMTLAAGRPVAAGQPIAALTRAAIRTRHAGRFWRSAPASEAGLTDARGCRLAVGLGEAPLLRQATFSLWDDSAALDAYARHGAHRAASLAAWQEGWFSEWMFVRFEPLSVEGQWHGRRFG